MPTHLSAFIDCHSRYVVEARYYLRENLDILIDSLLRAWSVHGASRELYLDNAKIYLVHALKAACFAWSAESGFAFFTGRASRSPSFGATRRRGGSFSWG